MKRFITHSVVWIVGIALIASLVWMVEVPTAYRFAFAKNEGCNIEWINQRVQTTDKPIEIAFFGASHTGCGVNDALINQALGLPEGNVVNLSYCGGNRNIHKEALEVMLQNHKPELIILDVVRDEPKGSHRDFGFLADAAEVWQAPMLFNEHFFRDIWHNYQLHFFYFQDLLYQRADKEASHKWSTYGFKDVFVGTKDANHLEAYRQDELRKYEDWKSNGFDYIKGAKQSISLSYVKGFVDRCKAEGIQLVFLYIPAYGMVAEEPMHAAFYKQHGALIIPPTDIFRNPNYWIDEQHLNSDGSREFSLWVADKLKSI